MFHAQDFDLCGKHSIDHDIALMRDQLIGAAPAADAAESRMRCERRHFVLDEVHHFLRVRWTIFGNVLSDFDQVVNGLFFPVNGAHACALCFLDRGTNLAHRLVMRNDRARVVYRFLYLGFEPSRICCSLVRILHGGSAVWPSFDAGNVVRIVV